MSRMFYTGIGMGVLLFGILAIPMFFGEENIEAVIPPTPAWSKIATNDTDVATGGWANATTYNSELYIITDGSIGVEILNYTGGAE